jgi:large conductance mechanosensitive channel
MGIVRGFRNFVMRGNVVDLAVGVVIGAAFNSLIQQFSASFLEPLIKLISGGHEVSGTWKIMDVVFDWSKFLNAVIAFLLTAVALYFLVVLPVNKLHERVARGEEPEPEAPSQEVQLLTQIRDALTDGRVPAGARTPDGQRTTGAPVRPGEAEATS